MIDYISTGLKEYKRFKQAQCWCTICSCSKAFFKHLTISIFSPSVWIKIVAFPCFPVTFHIVTGFVRLQQSHLITCQETMENIFLFFTKRSRILIFLCKYSLSHKMREKRYIRVVKQMKGTYNG